MKISHHYSETHYENNHTKVLRFQLKFISKGISHIKNGCAIQGSKARNSNVMTTNNVMPVIIDKIRSFNRIQNEVSS